MESAITEIRLAIVGYIALFAAIGLAFVFVNLLLVGVSCGPPIRTKRNSRSTNVANRRSDRAIVQFDLRFYVVALDLHRV